MNVRSNTLIRMFLVVCAAAVVSCGTPAKKPQEPAPVPPSEMGEEEQSKKAFDIFMKIHDITTDNDRKTALPMIEPLYMEIIDVYPRAAIAQEAYWRLISIYLREYNPPAYEKIDKLYRRFIALYPKSLYRSEIEDNTAKSLFRSGKWQEIIDMFSPSIKNYIETGNPPRAPEMFMYSEAKFKLGDYVEAEKGYRIVISLFPNLSESNRARNRLQEIKDIKYRVQ